MRRGLAALSVVLAFGSALAPAAAVPPAAGGALASDNVDFVANIPDPGAIGGRVLRDVETALGPRDLLYVTSTQGLRIYDVELGVPVPVGALALPHFENEDVDTNGEILLIAADHFLSSPNILYVIDVSLPHAPVLAGVLPFPEEAHTVSCINDCSYAYLAGGRGLWVVDLTVPSQPRQVGNILGGIGRTHDVQVDETGIAWAVGSTLTGWATGDARTPSGAPYPAGATALAPKLFAEQDGGFNNSFILHNSMHLDAADLNPALLSNGRPDPGETVIVTEEDYITFAEDGSFQAGFLDMSGNKLVVRYRDRWTFANDFAAGTDHKIGLAFSSSHYFDHRDGVAAVGWYEQGTRFFDVSDPADIRPIGYFMPVNHTETWMAIFNGEWIYTIDVVRGIDVLHFTGSSASATVDLPVSARPAISQPDPRFAGCRIPFRAA